MFITAFKEQQILDRFWVDFDFKFTNLYHVLKGSILLRRSLDVWNRSSRAEVFCKKGILKNFAKACNFRKKETLAQVFSCDFWEVFKNSFFIEHLRWLLLMKIESRHGAYTKKNEIKVFELFERNTAWIKAWENIWKCIHSTFGVIQ